MHMSIRARLAIVVLLSLLPVALLAYLFVAQSQKDIGFAQKELTGARYLAALQPDLISMAAARPLGSDIGILNAAQQFDPEMGTAASSGAYLDLRERAGGRGADIAAALQALITKIGDGSNLILDPDLDSFYIMDLQVVKLPSFIASTAAMLDKIAAAGAKPEDVARIDIVANAGALAAATEGIRASYASATASNADGQIAINLDGEIAAFNAAATGYLGAIDKVIGEYGGAATTVDTGALEPNQLALVDAADALLEAVNQDLGRLLQLRIDGQVGRLFTMLGVSAGLVLLVLLASILAARSILMTIKRLVADITDVADQKSAATIRGAGNQDEIGAVARAAAYLRDRTVERQAATERLRLAGAEEAARATQDAARAREASLVSAAEISAQQGQLVRELSAALSKLSAGNLDCAIETPFYEELEAVRVDFNNTVQGLAQVIAGLKQTSGLLKSATGEILAGANNLAARTNKQGAMIEETSAAMEQVAGAVTQNARATRDVLEHTRDAKALGTQGGEAMSEASSAMSRISAASTRISSIVGLIDDIAFQTNLLALNASVEAARAGDAGKGFAVVAIEVRRLAQSAASASADVKVLIEQSGAEVRTGSHLVELAATRLQDIVAAVTENGKLIEMVSARSSEQSSAIAEVAAAVRSMDEMIQQNAALVEQTNAAIQQTEAQASDLDRVVDNFKLASSSKRPRVGLRVV